MYTATAALESFVSRWILRLQIVCIMFVNGQTKESPLSLPPIPAAQYPSPHRHVHLTGRHSAAAGTPQAFSRHFLNSEKCSKALHELAVCAGVASHPFP